jgi:hypothetical protein
MSDLANARIYMHVSQELDYDVGNNSLVRRLAGGKAATESRKSRSGSLAVV